MLISYNASVFTPAGWRGVRIQARAERTSQGMAKILEVLTIDGETPHYGQSRTGARRQTYNGSGVAQREVGARKRLSACIVEAA
jgi:hypothetical protein